MPILVLAARLCPEGVEATLFATLMSILNCGAFVGSFGGAALTQAFGVKSDNFDNLFVLVAVCTAGTLLPAPFLGLLPSEGAAAAEAAAAKKEKGADAGGTPTEASSGSSSGDSSSSAKGGSGAAAPHHGHHGPHHD